uniref:Uncharacterized protein n=1 Tax=Arundo donax TaxID=35708 RepID=A0A0A9FKA5_ARUDO
MLSSPRFSILPTSKNLSDQQ